MSRRTYVDNAMNRSLGRVGMAHGSCVHSASASRSSSSSYSSYSGGASYGGSSYRNTSTPSSKTYVDNALNRSLGRVGMTHGTCVQHRDGSVSRSTSASQPTRSLSGNRSGVYVDNPLNQSLGRVGKEYGTHVQHKDGSVTVSSAGSPTTVTGSVSQGVYTDNKLNRKLGRVGKPLGTHVQHKDGTVTKTQATQGSTKTSTRSQGVYVDNALNRRLDRVGKSYGTHIQHKDGSVTVTPGQAATGSTKKKKSCKASQIQQQLVGESTLGELTEILHGLDFKDPDYPAVENAQYQLQREEIEEKWKRNHIYPGMIEEVREPDKQIIPYADLVIDDQIGQGGFGKVYAGLWKDKPIAFKKLIFQMLTKKKQKEFVEEIKVFSYLQHPNIVKLYGVVMEKDNIGIVMEYLSRSLFQAIHIDEVEFSSDDKRRILTNIVSALKYLHTPDYSRRDNPKGEIAHCDIKTQNVLLDSNNVAKLCDFGLSTIKKTTQTSSHSSASPGRGYTPRYAAPEVLKGQMLTLSGSKKSDIYSLSLVMYEVLVEEEPYEDLNLMQLIEHVGRGTRRPSFDNTRPGMTAPVKKLLQSGWAIEASSRPDISQFCTELTKIDSFFV